MAHERCQKVRWSQLLWLQRHQRHVILESVDSVLRDAVVASSAATSVSAKTPVSLMRMRDALSALWMQSAGCLGIAETLWASRSKWARLSVMVGVPGSAAVELDVASASVSHPWACACVSEAGWRSGSRAVAALESALGRLCDGQGRVGWA